MPAPLEIPIRGMHCAGCVASVEEAARAVAGVRSAAANFATESARLEVGPGFDPKEFRRELLARGYRLGTERRAWNVAGLESAASVPSLEAAYRRLPGVLEAELNPAAQVLVLDVLPGLFDPGSTSAVGLALRPRSAGGSDDPEERAIRWRTWTALPLAAAVMVLSMRHGEHSWPWIQAVLSGVVQFACGWGYHAGLGRSLRRFRADMSTLVSLGTNVAWFASLATLLRGTGGPLYFDTAAMILAIVLLGRLFELKARSGTRQALRAIAGLLPKTATRVREGIEEEVQVDELRSGDLLRLRNGSRIPADGVVTSGAGEVDESLLTGEPLPVPRGPGDPVLGGTINGSSALEIRVTGTGEDTAAARIRRLVAEAQGSKAPIQRLADRIASVFVPAVLAIALATAVTWVLLGNRGAALDSAVAVLVVACPCAMGLAAPAAVMVAVGRSARFGVLVKDAAALESLGRIRLVAFDKTGTLTSGAPRVVESDPEALRLAAAVERGAEHPIARAIVAAAGDGPRATEVKVRPGLGALGILDGVEIVVGSRAFFELLDIPAGSGSAGGTTVHVARDGRLVGTLRLTDTIRGDAKAAVGVLAGLGIETTLLSGDEEATARAVAAEVGIREARGRVLPGDKADAVRALAPRGPVAMVGDGINDAPALAAADVGIAIGHGADVAVESADVVLVKGGLGKIPAAIRLARRTRRVILQNFAWAAGYNVLLVPLAAAGWLDPMLAAGAMALSSISVLLNSLRLGRFDPGAASRTM